MELPATTSPIFRHNILLDKMTKLNIIRFFLHEIFPVISHINYKK